VSFELIIPGCGSTLFAQESLDFPAIRAAQALGRDGVKGFCPEAAPEVVVARTLGVLQGTLLAKAPLALLEGLWITAFATGAGTAIVALEAPCDALAEGIAALERLGLLTALTLEVKVVGSSYMAGEDAALNLYSPPQYSALSLCWEGELPIVPCCRQHDSCDITMMTYSMPRSLLKSLGECQNVIPGCAL